MNVTKLGEIPHVTLGILVVALMGIGVGCGGDGVTDPSETGAVQSFVADEPENAAAVPAEEGPQRTSSATYSGSLDAQAQVSISADGETWVELGPPRSISVGLQATGGGADVHGSAQVPVGTYSHVRLLLGDARANVAVGSTIGSLLLDVGLSLTLGTEGQVTIEKSVPPFQVRAEGRTEIHWNMNSDRWMTEDNAEEEEVEEEEVEGAAEARTEERVEEQP